MRYLLRHMGRRKHGTESIWTIFSDNCHYFFSLSVTQRPSSKPLSFKTESCDTCYHQDDSRGPHGLRGCFVGVRHRRAVTFQHDSSKYRTAARIRKISQEVPSTRIVGRGYAFASTARLVSNIQVNENMHHLVTVC